MDIKSLFKALALTYRHFFMRKITIQYPEELTPKSLRFRGLPILCRYPNKEERCIGCKLCAAVCPASAIKIETEDITCNEKKKVTKYEIDLFKCIYCGFCVEACPVAAIIESNIDDYCLIKKEGRIITKKELLTIGDYHEENFIDKKDIK